MIPLLLQSGLKERIERLFASKSYVNKAEESVFLHVFEQHLPEVGDDTRYFPYVIIKLDNGDQETVTDPHNVRVIFVIGIYNDDENNQGHKDVINIMNQLIEEFSKNPIQSGKYELSHPIRWALHEENVAPYYLGGLETTWTTQAYNREFEEDYS